MEQGSSSSFALLAPPIQHWVENQGWAALNEIQENAIPVILSKQSDVIISAATAGGKTEAAFLPILTSIISSPRQIGYHTLYISPLKALINDQYHRLRNMVGETNIDITPWHGDIEGSIKTKSLKFPNGILIITPESLESFLINRKYNIKWAFGNLQYIVIDELHAFIGTERGKQLQSLLSRIEIQINRVIPRIAMSATFSDFTQVKSFLRPEVSFPCVIPEQGESDHEIKILVKEYTYAKFIEDVFQDITTDIYAKLRGSSNLVFTNSRADCEDLTWRLNNLCSNNHVPSEFRIHHGSISRIERTVLERDLKQDKTPITTICTSTLELGVDIAKVKSVAQIGEVNSVAGLRQRLGRSGRRNEASILRVYSIDSSTDEMRYGLIQNIAAIELLKEHVYEMPSTKSLHLSTFIQQILAIIAQCGCVYPKDCWLLLCKRGVFRNITSKLFLQILKCLGNARIISQLNSGLIVIGIEGEKIISSKNFYVVFYTPVEYNVINLATLKTIGVLPDDHVDQLVGATVILCGKEWLVERINKKSLSIYVSPIKNGGELYPWRGPKAKIDVSIVRKMRTIYESSSLYPYLDSKTNAAQDLTDARAYYLQNHLKESQFVHGEIDDTYFTWAGSKVNETIALIIELYLGKDWCFSNSISVFGVNESDIRETVLHNKPNPIALAALVKREDKITQKYDYLLSDDLLNLEYASTYLDVDAAWDVMNKTLGCSTL